VGSQNKGETKKGSVVSAVRVKANLPVDEGMVWGPVQGVSGFLWILWGGFQRLLRLPGYANLNFCAVLRGKWKCVCVGFGSGDGFWAGVAQLVEHLICNQRVGGSNPFASSTQSEAGIWKTKRQKIYRRLNFLGAGPVLAVLPLQVQAAQRPDASGGCGVRESGWGAAEFAGLAELGTGAQAAEDAECAGRTIWAQVAERLMAADCKSAAPCELRRFESSPVHQKNSR
jgi:hypothetical protein